MDDNLKLISYKVAEMSTTSACVNVISLRTALAADIGLQSDYIQDWCVVMIPRLTEAKSDGTA